MAKLFAILVLHLLVNVVSMTHGFPTLKSNDNLGLETPGLDLEEVSSSQTPRSTWSLSSSEIREYLPDDSQYEPTLNSVDSSTNTKMNSDDTLSNGSLTGVVSAQNNFDYRLEVNNTNEDVELVELINAVTVPGTESDVSVPTTETDALVEEIDPNFSTFLNFRNLNISDEERERNMDRFLAVKFMTRFGYVPEEDNITSFLFTPESMTEQIKEVQRFGDIPQTGELDETTIKLMKSPRCGVPDIAPDNPEDGPTGGLTIIRKQGQVVRRVFDPDNGEETGHHRRPKRYIVGGGGWNKRQITYHVENYTPKLHNISNVERELKRAFDAWSSYSRLNFTSTSDRAADIIIYFAPYDHYDGYPFDGQGGTLAHAYYPYEFGHYGGDIHFDESEQWAINPKDQHSGLDFFTVAVHEIGHSLGLAHSPVSTSIMFPYYKGSSNDNSFPLGYDDIRGMWELYIQRHLPGDEEYFSQSHGGSDSTTTESTTPSMQTSTTTTTTTTMRPSTTTTATAVTTTTPAHVDETQNDAGFDDDTSILTGKNDDNFSGRDDNDINNDDNYIDDRHDDEWSHDGSGNGDTNASNNTATNTTASSTDTTINYVGDSMSVDEFHKLKYGGPNLDPTITLPLSPTEEEERRIWEEERRRRVEEEERRHREEWERREQEERNWYEEEERRREEEAKRREEDRKNYEEEIRRKEEEALRNYEEMLKKREAERKAEAERRRQMEEERVRKAEEERMKAYEEELRRYEEEIRQHEEERRREAARNNSSSSSSHFDTFDASVSRGDETVPDICSGAVDAAAKIVNDLFMFKGDFMWRFESRGVLREGYPAPLRALFSSLPTWTSRVDAVYQRHNDSVVVFFVGKYFYEYRSNQVSPSQPRPLSDLGLPDRVTQLDAALYWPKNNKVYFFRHEEYWRFDDSTGVMEAGYPQTMDRWYGVPPFINAAFTWQTVSYFFKGELFWEFDNLNVKTVDGYPKRTRDIWFSHC